MPTCGAARPTPGARVHRLDHLLGEADDLAVDLLDLGGALAQDGVAEDPDGEGRHRVTLPTPGRRKPRDEPRVAAAMSSTARANTSRFAWRRTVAADLANVLESRRPDVVIGDGLGPAQGLDASAHGHSVSRRTCHARRGARPQPKRARITSPSAPRAAAVPESPELEISSRCGPSPRRLGTTIVRAVHGPAPIRARAAAKPAYSPAGGSRISRGSRSPRRSARSARTLAGDDDPADLVRPARAGPPPRRARPWR